MNLSFAEDSAAKKPEPEMIVQSVTDQLLNIAQTKADLLASDPDAYFAEINGVLEPVVDFVSIAKNVMGKKYWTSVSPEQQRQFVDVFRSSLVETYGKGMTTFANLDIKVESSRPSEKSNRTHYVVQTVKTKDGLNKVVYTVTKKDDAWKLRNVVLNGVNLGKTFRSQFAQSVKDNGNDVGMAIAKWGQADS
jgi:phospholipid transport system substrate-binding protein